MIPVLSWLKTIFYSRRSKFFNLGLGNCMNVIVTTAIQKSVANIIFIRYHRTFSNTNFISSEAEVGYFENFLKLSLDLINLSKFWRSN